MAGCAGLSFRCRSRVCSLARRPAVKHARGCPEFGALAMSACAKGCARGDLRRTENALPTAAMPDLLLELFSEEIPARMQARAVSDLKRLVTDALVERGLVYEGAAAFATPRRLALHVAGIPVRQPDTREEKKGPRVGAPEAAAQGFLKSAGLASIADA